MTIYRLGSLSPELPPAGTYWVASDAVVIGQVTIGRDVGIWHGATIRADNEPIVLGEGTNVQEKVTMHVDPGFPMLIGTCCTIGHNAILHGCTIGDNSLIGLGATVLNGARIGANCLVGANALVTEGKEFPDGFLIVGSPARAVRPLTEREIAKLRFGADHYIARWKQFTTELVALDV
ncbi:MAG: gamma carbonic anhydrase family protein [Pseudomonadota bacterium]|nr:gamma carbonic anhydrase family protein [Pseudomonadota bacterium]